MGRTDHHNRAFVLALALATLVGGPVLLSGCRSKAEKIYRRAGLFMAQDKPELAAQEYERVVKVDPRNPLAAQALFKLGYLYRAPLGKPKRALLYYEELAQDHPRSSFADDALLWVAYLSRTELKNVAMVRSAVDRLESGHSDTPRTCARGRVELALALLDAHDPESRQVCEEILKRYPDQTRQCAQSQLILARIAETLDKDPEAAVKQYELLVKNYPDSTSAVEAKQRIGLLYFGQKRAEAGKKPPPGVVPPSKQIAGVPPFAEGGEQGIQILTLAALRSLLRHRGTEADLDTLLAVSGAAFQFVYDRANRPTGAAVFATNPFETVASTFGFTPLQGSSETPEEAMLSLCQALDLGRPAAVPYSPQGWVIVTGYDKQRNEFTYLRPGAEGARAEKFDEFARRWKEAASQGSGALSPFYQFSLGPQRSKPAHGDLVRDAAGRGGELLLRRTSVLGRPAGLAAYQALIDDLEAHANGVLAPDAADLQAWGGEPLSVLRRARRAAAAFLGGATGAAYQRLEAKLAELQRAFPRVPEGAKVGTTQPEYNAAAAESARLARQAMDLEREAADSLAGLAGG